ncbi:MAG: hypothetical protein JSV79_05790 [Armatimonadota bacterium]|nr:MAG: hypothetical protein JSV79_05790 [Armatimonadota bacterium]
MANRSPHDHRASRRSERSSGRRRKSERSPAPYLAELRRRATARLRELSVALETAREEYQAAAAECARLRAPDPGGLPEADPTSPASADDIPQGLAPNGDPGAVELPVPRVAALEEKLSEREEALAAERQQRQEVEDRALELEQKLGMAEDALAQQQARARELVERERELEARLESVRTQAADGQAESLETARNRLCDMETRLKSVKAVNARLRAEMTELLSFLDELNGVLSAAAR